MAKAPKTNAADEAAIIPAPLAAAVEEQDTVLQAHFTRQATHFTVLAPKIAKQARDDAEREAMLQEHELIAERNRKEREAQQKEQEEREERENAAANAARLREEAEALEAELKAKKSEAERLEKLAEGK